MSNLYFLVGFMGAGKTTLGQTAADELGYTFLDLDKLIENRAEMSIKEIFVKHGETYFRQLEHNLLVSLTYLPSSNYLIATGGGTPCFHENMQWMKAHGHVIFLNPSVKTLAERLAQHAADRPLLKGLTMTEIGDFVRDLLGKRNPFYLQAHQVIDDADLHPQALIERIQRAYAPN